MLQIGISLLLYRLKSYLFQHLIIVRFGYSSGELGSPNSRANCQASLKIISSQQFITWAFFSLDQARPDAGQLLRPYLPFGRRNKTIKSIYSKNLSISLLSDLDFFQRAASGTALEWARRKQSLITRLRDQLATCGFQNIAALAIQDNILRPHILHESGRCPTKPKLEVAVRLGTEYC